jgi:hypothetical protein
VRLRKGGSSSHVHQQQHETEQGHGLGAVQALVAGTQKHFPNGSFTIGGTAYTATALIQALQSLEQAIVAVNAAQSNAKDAVLTLHGVEATVAPLMRDFKRFVLSTFGTATQELADFGLQPPKARKPLDSEKRAAATAKLRATRAARGTTSKKQKLTVKGNVTGVIVTPVTAPPAAPPAVTSPAGSAPAAGSTPQPPPAQAVPANGGATR